MAALYQAPYGSRYGYLDKAQHSQWQEADDLAATGGNPLAHTVQQIYEPGASYVTYKCARALIRAPSVLCRSSAHAPRALHVPSCSPLTLSECAATGSDQPYGVYELVGGKYHAHAKGVIGYQDGQGFWLVHSNPHFPDNPSEQGAKYTGAYPWGALAAGNYSLRVHACLKSSHWVPQASTTAPTPSQGDRSAVAPSTASKSAPLVGRGRLLRALCILYNAQGLTGAQGGRYGQSYLCITMSGNTLETVASALRITGGIIGDSNTDSRKNEFPELDALANTPLRARAGPSSTCATAAAVQCSLLLLRSSAGVHSRHAVRPRRPQQCGLSHVRCWTAAGVRAAKRAPKKRNVVQSVKSLGGEQFLQFAMTPTMGKPHYDDVYLYEQLVEPTLQAGAWVWCAVLPVCECRGACHDLSEWSLRLLLAT